MIPGPDAHATDAKRRLAPGVGEAAVLSILAVAADGRWRVVAGSLLTCPYSLATTSWRRWHQVQPRTRPHSSLDDGPDFGPVFCIEPSPGVRAARATIARDDWQDCVDAIRSGHVNALDTRYTIATDAWTSSVFLSRDGASPAHEVVKAARRPTTGIVATVAGPVMPPTSPFLELASPRTYRAGRPAERCSAIDISCTGRKS